MAWPGRTGGVWVFWTVCCERVVLSSPGRGARGWRQEPVGLRDTGPDPSGVEGAGGSGGARNTSGATSNNMQRQRRAGGRVRRRPENRLFAFKGVGGVGVGRSAGGGVGGVPILPPVGPRCAWRGVAVSGSVCQFRVCSCLLGRCTRSVGNAPLLFGCTAT